MEYHAAELSRSSARLVVFCAVGVMHADRFKLGKTIKLGTYATDHGFRVYRLTTMFNIEMKILSFSVSHLRLEISSSLASVSHHKTRCFEAHVKSV